MDIKITSGRVKNLLSYDWLKMIFAIVAGIIVWSLLFTTLGTRITVGEEFYLTFYENVYTQGNSSKNYDLLAQLKDEERLSYDVLSTNVTAINSAGHYTAGYMLTLRVETQEGDVMIVSDGRAEEKTEERDPTADINSIVNNRYMVNIENFLKGAESYCLDNGFITVSSDGFTVNESVIEEYFFTVRLKSAGNYRKTYRTQAQKQEGAKKEIERITAIYENYLYVSNAINKAKEQGNDFLWYGELYEIDEMGQYIKDDYQVLPFGIDLYKLNQPFKEEDGVKNIEDMWYTYSKGVPTSEGLVLMVFDFTKHQPDMQYESLAFIRYIIETYSRY